MANWRGSGFPFNTSSRWREQATRCQVYRVGRWRSVLGADMQVAQGPAQATDQLLASPNGAADAKDGGGAADGDGEAGGAADEDGKTGGGAAAAVTGDKAAVDVVVLR